MEWQEPTQSDEDLRPKWVPAFENSTELENAKIETGQHRIGWPRRPRPVDPAREAARKLKFPFIPEQHSFDDYTSVPQFHSWFKSLVDDSYDSEHGRYPSVAHTFFQRRYPRPYDSAIIFSDSENEDKLEEEYERLKEKRKRSRRSLRDRILWSKVSDWFTSWYTGGGREEFVRERDEAYDEFFNRFFGHPQPPRR